MKRLRTDADWLARAAEILPAAGLGNFDASIMVTHGDGSHVWDAQGRRYIDYLIGSGPMLLGHGNKEVMEVVLSQLTRGMTYFTNNPQAIELAEEIVSAVPCAEQVRYVSSGGEADMYAIRLARAATGRTKILKFEGGYHGMSAEAQMSLAPAKPANFPTAVPDSAGIPMSVRDEMLIAPYNDLSFVEGILAEQGNEIAAVIVEPLQRIIPAQEGFLAGLKAACEKRNVLLIFDEIVTGFRLAYGGAQERYGVVPDICTLGKVIGGGFALAAVAARAELMAHFDKDKVGQADWLMQLGTLSGNPVAAAAGLKTMEILKRPGQYDRLRAFGSLLQQMQAAALTKRGIAHQIVGDATLFDVLFTPNPVWNYRDGLAANGAQSAVYNTVLREEGILKSPSKLYPSLALSEDDLAQSEIAFEKAAEAVAAM